MLEFDYHVKPNDNYKRKKPSRSLMVTRGQLKGVQAYNLGIGQIPLDLSSLFVKIKAFMIAVRDGVVGDLARGRISILIWSPVFLKLQTGSKHFAKPRLSPEISR